MGCIWIKGIRYLVTCDDEDRMLEHADMVIKDREIVYIGKDAASAADGADSPREACAENGAERDLKDCGFTKADLESAEVIDARHMAVYPGLVNTHHHLYQIFTRNLPTTQNMELFDWLRYLYEIWKKIDCEDVRLSTLVGVGELMKTGCTTVFDHHYVFPGELQGSRAGSLGAGGASRSVAWGVPSGSPKECGLIDAQAEAAAQIGVRMHFSRGSMSLSKKDGGLPPDEVVQTTDEIIKDSERLIDKLQDPSRFSMSRIALAPCSPFSVTKDLLVESARLARAKHVRLHTHLAETKDEENYMLERYGMRPLAYMEETGWLGSDVWFAHGIHFDDRELKLLADTGTGVAHCPISNMKLSSGVARVPEMLRLGVPVGLAVDGSASNDGSNLLEEMRVCYLLHRLNSSSGAPSGYDCLKLATRGGARLLGRDDIGYLAEGMAADLFMIDTRKLELAGALADPRSVLATVGYKGSVDMTIVNGRVTVRDGKLTTIDEERIASEANLSVEKLCNHAL
ncbi:MAG: amidohydrolase family protein [Lachnospiraceae bacterium]|nr:amidohydrolase family protein [Lachnospiraceae bacterium]